MTDSTEKIIAYKGFDKNLRCLDMQYEVGQTYKHDGDVVLCESGFHACPEPFDVFEYCVPSQSRFCEVEICGNIASASDKVACSDLKVLREIPFSEFVRLAADHKAKAVLANLIGNTEKGTDSRSAATNTGNRSAATNIGNRSAATNTGDHSAVVNTGDYSAATNTGDRSVVTNNGERSAATNTGDYSVVTNTGFRSTVTNTGNCSVATNTGSYSAVLNTGNCSAVTNAGDNSAAINTGEYSAATNVGYHSAVIVSGKESIACGLGYQCKAKASEGSWIALVERDCNGEILHAKFGKAGQDIKADVFYILKDGEFVEETDDDRK